MAEISGLKEITEPLTGNENIPMVSDGITRRSLMMSVVNLVVSLIPGTALIKNGPGPTGPTFTNLATFKEQPTTNLQATLMTLNGGVPYSFLKGDFSGVQVSDLDDDYIKSNHDPLSYGAWIKTGATIPDLGSTAEGKGASLIKLKNGRTLEHSASDITTALDIGAVGDGSTDDSAAINASNKVLQITSGNYAVASLSRAESFSMDQGASLLFNGPSNGTLLDFMGNGKKIGYLNVSGGGQNCTLAKISGDNNQIGTVILTDVTASATGTPSIFGLAMYGDGNTVDRVEVRNFKNTGFSNESFPQGLFFHGDNNHVSTVFADGAAAAITTSTLSGSNTIDRAVLRNVKDNGIYHLGGELRVGSLDYEGSNEPFVSKGGTAAKLHIGYLYHNGTGIPGVENAGDVTIDHLHMGSNAGSIFRTRAGQTASGHIHIKNLTGEFSGVTLWALNIGTVEYLTIDNMDVTYRYDSTKSGSISRWADFSGCRGFRFGTLRIRIIDINDVLSSSTDRFTLRAPTTNLAYDSFVDKIIVTIEKSDGTISPAQMRGVGFFDNVLIHVNNAYIDRLGPYLREVTKDQAFNGLVQNTANAPIVHTVRDGEIFKVNNPVIGGPVAWIRIAGTWKPLGVVGQTQVTGLTSASSAADIVAALQEAGIAT